MQSNPITGALLGTAVGDALGLPYEALSRRRAARLFGTPDRHRFAFGRGMVSDDTEHSCLVAQALCRSGGDVEGFRTQLAWSLRGWLLCIPAGLGFATLRAILKLCLGFSPRRSGVFSAGNGPAMRAAVLGAAITDTAALAPLVAASTTITHTDPKAFAGALAVALAARESAAQRHDGRRLIDALSALAQDAAMQECCDLLRQAIASVDAGESTLEFADRLGCDRGVSGYVFHTVPVAIHAWLSFPRDFSAAVRTAIACGGDTDTLAAIVGGIVGAGSGRAGIPQQWLDRLTEWPRSVPWMERLGAATASAIVARSPVTPPRVFAPFVLLRNLVFLALVLGHAARRALPPY